MPFGLMAFVAWMVFVIVTATGLFLWGWRRGQFRDVEQAKFDMLNDREPEPWSERKDDAK